MKETGLLYSGTDQMEEAMLRSVLLFNGKIDMSKRQNMMLKAILAIVIYGNGTTKVSEIESILSKRFKVETSEQDIRQMIHALSSKDLVSEKTDGTIVANTTLKGKEDFFTKLKAETDALVEGIINRILNQSFTTVPDNDKSLLQTNIRNALAVYYSTYGYKYFGVSRGPKTGGVETAVETARRGLSKKVGQAAVRALADTIENPTTSELRTLEKWARAYVTMEVLNLDPMLRNFTLTKMSEKEFVVDTDVALHAITTHAKHSHDYRLMISSLKSANCKFYIPDRVVDEILDHTDAAWKWYGSLGPQVVEFTDEYLDNQIGNVFIEDYVKRIQSDPSLSDMDFSSYLNNYKSDEDPTLIWDSIREVFGDNVDENHLNLIHLNDDVKNELKAKVLEKTSSTPKGAHRTEEENERIAELDASLYLTLLSMNKNSNGDEKPLSQRTYLLTSSDRTNKCAMEIGLYQKDICCNPKGLLAMMQETGSLGETKIEIVNLFENPFLVYTAEEVWQEVEPLIKKGVHLKYAELRRLRLDVDTHIDRILTCKTSEERFAEAQRLDKRGYLFSQDLLVANQTIAKQEQIITEKDNTIQNQVEEIGLLKDRLKKSEEYIKKNRGKIKQKHGKRKP